MAFHIPDSNLTLYADDHQLYVTGKTYEEVESTLVTQGQQALLLAAGVNCRKSFLVL